MPIKPLVFTASALLAAHCLGQTVLPAVSGSAEDNPRNGTADTVTTTSTLIREQSFRENRAFAEYSMAQFAGMTITSAIIRGQIVANNSFDNGPRNFNIELYAGDGAITAGDFNAAATVVGNTTYHPPNQTSVNFEIDATAAVQALMTAGATHVGLRVDPTTDPNFPNILIVSGSTATRLDIVAVPVGGGCGTSDFNGDDDFGTDADIEAFFACLAGNCCATCWEGGSDFNGDGDFGTDADIESFFRVLAGGEC